MEILIVDYGVGNLRSVQKAFEAAGHKAVITGSIKEILSASAVLLPGVGAFGKAMDTLRQAGLIGPLREVAVRGTPLIGICLGMQLLFDESEETFGGQEKPTGLGIIKGNVRRFPPGLKIPQIGWNQLYTANRSPLFRGLEDGSFVYFVHSYYVEPENPEVVSSWTDYGLRFASSVTQGNVMGIQFHPEKSSTVGLRILRNFADFASGNLS